MPTRTQQPRIIAIVVSGNWALATPETSREGEGLMAAAPIGDRGGRLFVRVLELDRVHAREPLGA